MLYKKKPVSVEAFQLGCEDMPLWFQEAVRNNQVSNINAFLENVNETVKIKTLEGVMTAQQGDWIIKGVKEEIYPCKDEVFKATYDYVNLVHIKVGTQLAGKYIYIDEVNYLGNTIEDIIVVDDNHKIVTKKDAEGNISMMSLIDTNETTGQEVVLYKDGKRQLNKVLVPDTFGEVASIKENSIAYEILKIEE